VEQGAQRAEERDAVEDARSEQGTGGDADHSEQETKHAAGLSAGKEDAMARELSKLEAACRPGSSSQPTE
jgi:hypothetical protein